jgi:pyruvate formate lyase activating enzyme
MREALLYKNLGKENLVQCRACQHYCTLKVGEKGECGVRQNRNGELYSLVYGKVAALNIDPIEKKPFFHFLPGSESLSFGTRGCNFQCKSCQNWDISQSPKITGKIEGEEITPEKIVELAIRYQCPSISYTYNEPTVFVEFALDTMKLAKKRGLRNCWISNGFMSKETLDLICPYLDAINIDLKGMSEDFYQNYCGGRLKPVLENIVSFKKRKIWVEVTTLAIPGVIDEKVLTQIAKFIKEKLGKETPWHISRFFPEISWRLRHLYATPVDLVQKGCDIGMEMGLLYVYGGNVPGLASEDTYCPKCHQKMIDRTGYAVERKDKNGKCSNCGADLNIIG